MAMFNRIYQQVRDIGAAVEVGAGTMDWKTMLSQCAEFICKLSRCRSLAGSAEDLSAAGRCSQGRKTR
jgi:hypothetical protein